MLAFESQQLGGINKVNMLSQMNAVYSIQTQFDCQVDNVICHEIFEIAEVVDERLSFEGCWNVYSGRFLFVASKTKTVGT